VTFGLAASEVVAYKLALMGATDAQIEAGRAAAQTLEDLKKYTDAQKDAAKAAEDRKKAEADLANSLNDVRAQLAVDDKSDGIATQRLQLERQRDALLKDINTTDPSND